VPLKALVDKFSHTRFEPSGFTKNPEIPIAKSITDYIFRWLASKFLSQEEKQAVGVILREPAPVGPGGGERSAAVRLARRPGRPKAALC
jgi:ribonucleoside-diphosphate reductase alpha chain